MSDARAT